MNGFSLFVGFVFIFISCEKESTSIQEPFFSYLKAPNITIDTIEKAASVWEYGFKFKPIKGAYLKALGVKLPTVGKFKVKLYNLNLNAIVIDTMIQSPFVNAETFIDVAPIPLNGNTEYGVALVADVFFKVRHTNNLEFVFPQEIGSIKVIGFFEEKCGNNGCPSFPAISNSLVIAPCVSFKYISN